MDNNSSSMPNQYAKVMYIAKGEEIAQNYTDQSYDFVCDFFKKPSEVQAFMNQKTM
jgi:hypothetical protein